MHSDEATAGILSINSDGSLRANLGTITTIGAARSQGRLHSPIGGGRTWKPALARGYDEYLRGTGFNAEAAVARFLACPHFHMVAPGLRFAALPAEQTLARLQMDRILLAGCAAYSAAIAQIWVHQTLILAGSVPNGAERALTPAKLATATMLPIDRGDVLRREENLHHARPHL